MQNKLIIANKVYPWLAGLTNNLVFYVVINTVWLTNVKGFDAMQVIFLEACVGLGARVFMAPVLRLSERLGNTWSMRLGIIALFITSILLTLGNNYWVFVLAMVFQALSIVFTAMRDVLIQNNLNHLHKSHDYIRIASRAHLIYTVATMVTSVFSGFLFSIWESLPMILGIITCGIGVVLSFLVFDVNDQSQLRQRERLEPTQLKPKLNMPHPVKLSLLLFLFCGLLYGIIDLGQNDSKLLLQYQLETQYTVDQVVSFIGLVWFITRVIRIIVDLIYPKLHHKLQDRIGIILSFCTLISIVLVLLGFFLQVDFALRILLISAGYALFPAWRDPLHIFCQAVILKQVNKSDRKNALVNLVVLQQAGKFLFSLLASAMLVFLPLQYVIIMLAIAIIPVIVISMRLSRLIRKSQ